MTIGTADIHTAIQTAWDGSGLNEKFCALWPAGTDPAANPVLHDQEASPKQPFPYCVMSTEKPRVVTRMSGTATQKYSIRDVLVSFTVHAEKRQGDDRSPKQISAYLFEEIAKVFGGHPTVTAGRLSLVNGSYLLSQYVTDYPFWTEQYKHSWMVQYRIVLDVPVALGV